MTTAAVRPACFLCRAGEPEIVQTLSAQEMRSVWRLAGLEFGEDIWARIAAVGNVHLYRCRKCGFEFFDPRLAGNDRFYAELHANIPGYYSPNRPENERNALFARAHGLRTILDVGCGTGVALDVAREHGLVTYGIELNPTAAAATRARGHTVFSDLLQDLEPRWEGQFDMISMNQLLEHVPDPVALVESSLRFLSKRGVIAIAVPNSEGILRWHRWMALNWPPHHLSRWRRRDLRHLAARCEMTVERSGGNQLLGADLELTLLANFGHYQELHKAYRGPKVSMIRRLGLFYRKTGMKYLFRSQGHSIFCFLRRRK